MNKNALSPVIATVLLVTLVVVLAAIVFFAAKSLIAEQLEKFGEPIEDICEQVNFNVESTDTTKEPINIIIANYGNIPIHSFDAKEIKEGNSQVNSFEFFLDSGQSIEEDLPLQMENPEEIILFPKVLGNVKGKKINKAFTCLNQGKTIKLQIM